MNNNTVNIIRNVLTETFSEEHIAVMDQLSEPIYDEDIADNLGLKATIVRTLLNDLHQASLVEYQRTKNKKTGWYTYKWLKRDDKVTEHVQGYLKEKRASLQNQLDNDGDALNFKCACQIVSYSDAMENNFSCISCNENFNEYNNGEVVEDIVAEITRIDSILEQTYHSA